MPFDQLTQQASRITYDDLFRNNEQHVGKVVYYRAVLLQVLTVKTDSYQIRAGVSLDEPSRSDPVYLHYVGKRLLEDDDVEIVARVLGLVTYQSVLGAKITIPELQVIQAHPLLAGGGK